MIVELHRKVSSLIEFLKQKWALHEVRIVSFFGIVCSECFFYLSSSPLQYPEEQVSNKGSSLPLLNFFKQ